MKSFKHQGPRTLTVLLVFSMCGCSVGRRPTIDVGSGARAAGLFRAAVRFRSRLVVSRRKQTEDALIWEEVKVIEGLPTVDEVIRNIELKDKGRGAHSYALTVQYRLEFQAANEPVVVIVHYYQNALSCSLWDSDYKMTDRCAAFVRGFLMGAGVAEFDADYDGLLIQ